MRLRSLLYVPAHRDDFLRHAVDRGADALILDLEDSVPANAKPTARRGLETWVPRLANDGACVFVRVNAEIAELDAIAACRAGAFGLVVPKVTSAAMLADLTAALRREGLGEVPMIALIEDPAALLRASDIAQFPGLLGIALGGEDFALSLGAEPIAAVLTPPKLMLHYVAKAHGLLSFGLLQSVAVYRDTAQLSAAAQEARRHGFDGATCIHPSAVAILNEAFQPSDKEVERAERLVAVMQDAEARGLAAIEFEGRMIDAPMLKQARRLIAASHK